MEFEQVHGFGSDLLAICCCVGREARWEREWGGGGGCWLRVGGYCIPLEELFLAGLVMRLRGKVREFIRIDEFSNHRCIS